MRAMEETTKQAVLVLLKQLVRQIQSMDDRQLSEVIAGTAKLEVRAVRRKRASPSTKHRRLTDEELRWLGETLRSIRTREEGNQLLDEGITTKDGMARLARQLDVSVQKSESADKIRARIIESNIGFRIRSAAIQGVAGRASNKRNEPTE